MKEIKNKVIMEYIEVSKIQTLLLRNFCVNFIPVSTIFKVKIFIESLKQLFQCLVKIKVVMCHYLAFISRLYLFLRKSLLILIFPEIPLKKTTKTKKIYLQIQKTIMNF